MSEQAVTTRINSDDDMPPMEVLRSAAAFLAAADREHQWLKDREIAWTLVDAMPVYFLYGQAIELALKAYLRARGFRSRELGKGKYGHNLLTLYRTCNEHFFFTDTHCGSMIGILTEYFSDANWHTTFRYVSDFKKEFPTFEAVSVVSRVLLEAVQPVCEGMDPLEAAMLAIQQEETFDETVQPSLSDWCHG